MFLSRSVKYQWAVRIMLISIILSNIMSEAFAYTPTLANSPQGKTKNQKISSSSSTPSQIDPLVINAVNSSGFEAFKKINKIEALNKNMMISPASLYTALAMAYNGAEGDTLNEMKNVLKLNEIDTQKFNTQKFNTSMQGIIKSLNYKDSDTEVRSANSLWYNQKFILKMSSSFNNIMKNSFLSEIGFFGKSSDSSIINNWISEKTNGKIENVVGKVNPDNDFLYLINAIYFNAPWKNKFIKNDIDFTNGSSISKYAGMQVTTNCGYLKNESFEAIRLAYGDAQSQSPSKLQSNKPKFSMHIFLPKVGQTVDQFINSLNIDVWNNWKQSFKDTKVTVKMPKFKYESKVEKLIDEYSQLGMPLAFNPNEAQFDKMANLNVEEVLYISKFLHNSFIDVNEKGTEATAVTVIGTSRMKTSSFKKPNPPVVFKADRPFVYAITNDTNGTIIFIGKLVVPTEKK